MGKNKRIQSCKVSVKGEKMRSKFIIFGHEISIRPEYEINLHITKFPEKEYAEEPKWQHSFPMEKRINVFVQYKGFVEYVFSRYGMALLNYGDAAFFHLEAILRSFREQRNRFEVKGATPEQLKIYDDRIHTCFDKTIEVVENQIAMLSETQSEDLSQYLEVLKKLKEFKIEDYYKD